MKNLLNLKNRIRYNTRSLVTRLSIRVYALFYLFLERDTLSRLQILINHPQSSREQSPLQYIACTMNVKCEL